MSSCACKKKCFRVCACLCTRVFTCVCTCPFSCVCSLVHTSPYHSVRICLSILAALLVMRHVGEVRILSSPTKMLSFANAAMERFYKGRTAPNDILFVNLLCFGLCSHLFLLSNGATA